jgi:hypothetical protein
MCTRVALIVASILFVFATSQDVPVWDRLLSDQACVIKDGTASYKLYYAGEDLASINLATSTDGLTWTEYPSNPVITDGRYHATVHYYETPFPGANLGTDPSFMDMHYRIWYAGPADDGWRYGESLDGAVWNNRMAVTLTTPLVTGVSHGIVDAVFTPDATNTGTDWTFRIYANVQWQHGGDYADEELIVVAFSANGYEWQGYDPTNVGYATPVFAPSHGLGDFDRADVGWFKATRNSANDWEAFYSGNMNGIGRAVSSDGLNWARTGVVVSTFDGVAWRNTSSWMPSVVAESDSLYRIYFLGSDNESGWNLGYINHDRPLPIEESESEEEEECTGNGVLVYVVVVPQETAAELIATLANLGAGRMK